MDLSFMHKILSEISYFLFLHIDLRECRAIFSVLMHEEIVRKARTLRHKMLQLYEAGGNVSKNGSIKAIHITKSSCGNLWITCIMNSFFLIDTYALLSIEHLERLERTHGYACAKTFLL